MKLTGKQFLWENMLSQWNTSMLPQSCAHHWLDRTPHTGNLLREAYTVESKIINWNCGWSNTKGSVVAHGSVAERSLAGDSLKKIQVSSIFRRGLHFQERERHFSSFLHWENIWGCLDAVSDLRICTFLFHSPSQIPEPTAMLIQL